MNQESSSNENSNNAQALDSSPIVYEHDILATKESGLNYHFGKPIKTSTNFSKQNLKRSETHEITLFPPVWKYSLSSLFNSEIKATEIEPHSAGLTIKIPQPSRPTLILKEYNYLQSFIEHPNNFHQRTPSEEKDTIVRSKSNDSSFKHPDIHQKRKTGPKRKYMEPVRLHSPRRKFPNRPYVPYDEIIGYADDIPYDHFGSRENRKKIENENPNNKIRELLNKIQSINQFSHEEEEKEISRKFEIVKKNPINILIVNKNEYAKNDLSIEKLPIIQIDKNLFKTVILPSPFVKSPPFHIFLHRILNHELKASKEIYQTTLQILRCWKRKRAFAKSDIKKYSTFAQMVAVVWPDLYQSNLEKNTEILDVKNMIENYHQLFLMMEEIELKYYSELSNISFNPNSLISFNYHPSMIFDLN